MFELLPDSFTLLLKKREFHLKASVALLIFLLAFLAKLRILAPSLGQHLYPIGYKPFFIPILLYSAPFLFLFYFIVSRGEKLKFGIFDLLFGLITLMHLGSFFWINRGFQPVNPILTDLSIYFLYLLVKSLHSHLLRNHSVYLLLLPLIPLASEAGHGFGQMIKGISHIYGSFYGNYNFLGMLLAMGIPVCISQALVRGRGYMYRLLFLSAAAILSMLIFQTSSRTAACGVALALAMTLSIYYWPLLKDGWNQSTTRLKMAFCITTVISGVALSYWIYSLRPLSIMGRGLLVKIGLFMLAEKPFSGIGFGEIPTRQAEYQGQYFAAGYGSQLDRMLAGNTGAVTSEYLGRAVENGLFGLLLYIPFWFLIFHMAFTLIKGAEGESVPHLRQNGTRAIVKRFFSRIARGEKNNMAKLCVGCTLILFLLMSIPYSPYRVVPIWAYFIYTLGIAVSLYESGKTDLREND